MQQGGVFGVAIVLVSRHQAAGRVDVMVIAARARSIKDVERGEGRERDLPRLSQDGGLRNGTAVPEQISSRCPRRDATLCIGESMYS
jgi:hypothetical protein